MSQLFDLPTTPIEDGVTVVEASAGTGKTYCLVGLVLRLLLERRVEDVSQLLVVTFTRAATQELVARLRGALGETCRLLAGEGESEDPFLRHLAETWRGDDEALRIAREALVRFDDLTVSTIHGFCQRVLSDNAFESGEPFEVELVENAAPLLAAAARDVWRRLLYRATPVVAAVVTEEGLGPESFVPDWRHWRRHPRVEVLPAPAGLEAATAGLKEARRALAAAWDLGAVRMLLEPRRFLRGAYFGGGVLGEKLKAADAFCREGEPSGLRPVLALAGERLERSLFKRDRRGVGTHPVIAACSAFAAGTEGFRHALRCRFVADLDTRFETEKRQSLTWSYDDLLRRLRRALDDERRGQALRQAVRRRYRAALIDEFQDTDLIQYEIFHRLFRRGPLVLIGDPKQAIYRFRGADVFAYLGARRRADRVYTLAHNWRAEAPLVEAVNAVFSRSPRPFVLEQIAFEPAVAARPPEPEPGRPPLHWLWVPRLRSREQARGMIEAAVVSEIVGLLGADEKLSSPADVAVLVRTNEQAAGMQAALRAAGVPSVVGRAGDVFESEEMRELEALLAAVADPGDATRLRAAWATRLWGDSAGEVLAASADDPDFARRVERFSSYRDDWRRRGFMPMIQRLFAERGVRRRLLASTAGERRLTNLVQATELVHSAERGRHLSPAALLTWLAGERARERLDTEDAELRLENDAPAVSVSTLHRAKGLEYEVVFCPYLWQARTADPLPVQAHTRGSRLVLDYGSEALAEHRSQAEAERLSEEARLAYVALTRARSRCYVAWGDVPGGDGPAASALGYLLRRPGGRPAPAATTAAEGEWVEQALAEVQAGRDGWRGDLERLVAGHPREMELRALEEMPAPSGHAAPALVTEPRPRAFRRGLPRPWSLESFSSLSRAGGDREAPDVADPEMPRSHLLQPETEEPEGEARPSGIAAFARGWRAGSCLHRVIEHCDLTRLDDAGTDARIAETRIAEARIAEALRRYGLEDARSHAPSDRLPAGRIHGDFEPAAVVRELLRDLAAAPLPGADFSLAGVPRDRWLVEWKFVLPLGRLTPRRLAEVFRTHGRGAVAQDYAPRLETLGRREVHGYLTGFVDLIFPHQGRWYLFDWKSNYLGPSTAAYDKGGMWHAMSHHHYVLQYHLYLVALHRFLRRRLAGYDYQRHVAGAFYVFLRGLRGRDAGDGDEADAGWYVDSPPGELIEALDELLGGGR